ncbi:MAG TPA: enoyl-CoA hydratase-related protein [Streptosporangiaceae bacterium]|nr:enoyl-CoA hydratase-related protein [Streptosporangiaceae bacterium]
MSDSVLLEVDDAVATITLNRPEARNALIAEMKAGLLDTLQLCGSDPRIRSVILTGAGQAFCAGQDLREHADVMSQGGSPLDTVRRHYNPMVTLITTMPKPVIAALPGVAAGAGASLAFACDFRIAARRASLLMAFARVGLSADTGASWTLQRLVGTARAAELLMLAEPVSADQALALGLVTKVVPDEDLVREVREQAAMLAAGPTAAYGAIKESLLYAAGHSLGESLEKEAELQARLGETEDHRDATAAFLSKAQPVYHGR